MFRNQRGFWIGFVLYVLGAVVFIAGILLIIMRLLGIPILL
ncbi:hypothetical protein P7G87_05310 [Enterococcus asini]|uniref:Uncharacterized protein n=1 Tax=Enterococcus asini TaxID=57732 RepID=A0AAW8TVA7_9ENTE|nr:hypothetical protein [Enterococcus asini]MDT2743680.1 hypothetical protein [Enterococcus asini]MDT2763665.1 hypothetical protein [Enterococcus asini]MDT2784088.1 hypothetical protein [Enterococcus asini]MDT2809594.1 hypothetical protein [Enterococcus asini]